MILMLNASPTRIAVTFYRFALLSLLLLFMLGLGAHVIRAATNTVLTRGDDFFKTGFEGASALDGWSGTAKLAPGYDSAQSICVEHLTGMPGKSVIASSVMASIVLPADAMRGCTVFGTAMIRAEKVSAKPNDWNGVKFMLAVEAPSGKSWPAATIEAGTFDWRLIRFSGRIPPDATNVTLVLGLEEVTGVAYYDNVRIYVGKAPRITTDFVKSATPYKGHALPRLRGAMVSPSIDAAGLKTFGQDWNANLIRWQLVRYLPSGKTAALEDYDAWLNGELKKLDAALVECERNGLRVVVDLHSPPGGQATVSGYVGSDGGLFTSARAQQKFVQVWERMTQRYKNSKPVWGFDLANEAVEGAVADDCKDWHELAETTANAIHAIDPDRTIILEAPDWGGPDTFRNLDPINASNVVYSVHMYVPMGLTHQGVFKSGPSVVYPGTIDGEYWDKARLETVLKPVLDFQRKYGVHIYVGEFSAIRWAPQNSGYRYLKDVIDLFESYGWDWSYHAFREWSGWSVEHNDNRQDNQPSAIPTERQKLLQEWFAKNQKPAF
jgi:hypothetical protein